MNNLEQTQHYEWMRRLVSARVRLSVRDVGSIVDDITAQVILDYQQFENKKEASTTSSTDDNRPPLSNEKARIATILTTITARRIADHYRSKNRHIVFETLNEASNAAQSSSPGPAEHAERRSLLFDTLSVISKLPERQRNLLLRYADEDSNSIMTAADRKQLSRARQHIKHYIEHKHGCSLSDLLDIEE